jgi:hypothetical protein
MSLPTTDTLDKSAPASCNRERRASVRYQSDAKGSCQSLSVQREMDWEATVLDISCHGIGLLLPRRFEPGTLLTVGLTEQAEGEKRLLLARVVRASAQPEGRWLVGCTLINPLTEDELKLLLSSAP